MANAVSALPFTTEFQVKLSLVGRGYSWMGDHLGIAPCWFSNLELMWVELFQLVSPVLRGFFSGFPGFPPSLKSTPRSKLWSLVSCRSNSVTGCKCKVPILSYPILSYPILFYMYALSNLPSKNPDDSQKVNVKAVGEHTCDIMNIFC